MARVCLPQLSSLPDAWPGGGPFGREGLDQFDVADSLLLLQARLLEKQIFETGTKTQSSRSMKQRSAARLCR
jgi:hypothetical protein